MSSWPRWVPFYPFLGNNSVFYMVLIVFNFNCGRLKDIGCCILNQSWLWTRCNLLQRPMLERCTRQSGLNFSIRLFKLEMHFAFPQSQPMMKKLAHFSWRHVGGLGWVSFVIIWNSYFHNQLGKRVFILLICNAWNHSLWNIIELIHSCAILSTCGLIDRGSCQAW